MPEANAPLSPALVHGGTPAPILTRGLEAGAFIARRWKRGDVHPKTGLVFWAYSSQINRAGRAEYEKWISPEKFKIRQETERYKRLAKRPELAAASALWKRANPEKVKKNASAYWRRNSVRLAPIRAERRWANREAVILGQKDYYRRNPHAKTAEVAKRRAKRAEQVTSDANFKFIQQFYITARRLSVCVGLPFEVEHVVAISKGGLHHQRNLQVLTKALNRRKHAK